MGRARLVQLHHHLARLYELAVECLVEVEDGLEAAVVVAGELVPLVARALQEDALHLGVRHRAGALELLLDQVLAPHAAAPRGPELRLQRSQRHPAVGALVRPVADDRARQLRVAAMRHDAVGEVARGHHGQPRQRTVGHRDVHELALARAVALAQRREDAHGRHQRAPAEVGDLARGLHRRPAAVAGQPEQADQSEVVHVVARAVAVRAVLPVTGDRAVDETGILLAQALVADAEAVEHAGAEGLEQHVVLAGQAQQHVAPALVLEVDPDRALVAVEREEHRRLRAVLGALVVWRRPADVVPHPRVLDLEDVGPEVRQKQGAEPPGEQPREVQDANAFQGSCHRRASPRARGPCKRG